MGGAGRFLRKEVSEHLHTWRLPVLGGVFLFFALTGPILAMLTPALLRSLQAGQPGLVIQIPVPGWRDAYAQWIKNLSQIGAFVMILVAAGSVSGEVSKGTAVLVLTKPLSRVDFIMCKAVVFFSIVVVEVVLGTVVTQAVTLLVFGSAPWAAIWTPTIVWLVFAALLIAIATLASSIVPTLAAAGLGLVAFFAISIAAMWGPVARFSPAGLTFAPSRILLGQPVALAWPLVTAAAGALALIAIAALLFSRREL